MPLYEYECDNCGARFEEMFKTISRAKDSIPCPECGIPARKLVTAAAHKIAHDPTGPVPQNTGTSLDWDYDKVIGRDAEAKWANIEKRNGEKDTLIRDEARQGRGITRDHLVAAGGDGNSGAAYRVITEPERQRVNTDRTQAMDARKGLPPPPPLPSRE